MKNKKGFTLVELLAVIAILAILVIMALPAVLRMYRQSRISSFQNEVRTVYRTAQSQFLGDSISLGSGQTIAYTNAGTSVTGVNVVKELDMTGNTDFKYYVLINVDGKVLNVRASNGTYSFSKQAVDTDHDLKIEDIDVETNNDSTLDSNITTTVCPTAEAAYGNLSNSSWITFVTRQNAGSITIGDELVIADEHFYVFGSDSTNTLLLSAKNIDTSTLLQSNSSDTKVFASSRYWCIDESYIAASYPGKENSNQSSINIIRLSNNMDNYIAEDAPGTCRLKDGYTGNVVSADTGYGGGNPWPYVYNSNAEFYTYVQLYVDYLIEEGAPSTISAKLLDVEDLISLGYVESLTKNNNDISSLPSWLYSTNYWTGSVCRGDTIFSVTTSGIINNVNGFDSNGVRPIIVVNTSDL